MQARKNGAFVRGNNDPFLTGLHCFNVADILVPGKPMIKWSCAEAYQSWLEYFGRKESEETKRQFYDGWKEARAETFRGE